MISFPFNQEEVKKYSKKCDVLTEILHLNNCCGYVTLANFSHIEKQSEDKENTEADQNQALNSSFVNYIHIYLPIICTCYLY